MSKTSNALTTATGSALTILEQYSPEQITLVKNTICRGASDDELKLFMYQAHKTQLDPFAKQIYSIARWDSKLSREVRTTQVSIDGFRLIAERTGKYEGQVGPFWCGTDGKWVDVWLDDTNHPVAAKVGVWKQGARELTFGVAKWSEYVQTYKDKQTGRLIPSGMWGKIGTNQLAKCAEALALRKAFPMELSGVYVETEMEQADSEDAEIQIQKTTPPPQEAYADIASIKAELIDKILKSSAEKCSTKGVTNNQKGAFMVENWGCKNGDQLKLKGNGELQVILDKVIAAKPLEIVAEVVKETKKADTKATGKTSQEFEV